MTELADHIPPVEPGAVRLLGSPDAMRALGDALPRLQVLLHSKDERLRRATVENLKQRGVSVEYGPPIKEA